LLLKGKIIPYHRLHVYGIETSQDITCMQKGDLKFKLRANENIEKLNNVKEKLANTGLKIEQCESKIIKEKSSRTDTFPRDVGWMDTRAAQLLKGKKLDSTNNKVTKVTDK
jgi:hypothetical protein